MLKITDPVITREQLTPDMLELVEVVETLPPQVFEILSPVVERLVKKSLIRRKALEGLHEAVVQLRLDIKYLQFDLECTQRERDEYRRRIE